MRYAACGFRLFYEHEKEQAARPAGALRAAPEWTASRSGLNRGAGAALDSRSDAEDTSIDKQAASSPNSQFPESMGFVKIKTPMVTTICTEQSQCGLCFHSLRGHSKPGLSDNITPCPAITKATRRISGPAPVLISAQYGHAGCTCKLGPAVPLPTSHARYSTSLPAPRTRPVSAGSSE